MKPDNNMRSDCCDAPVYDDYLMCSRCGEHCGVDKESSCGKTMTVTLTKQCISCGEFVCLDVNLADLQDYQNGKLIQNAFPYLTADEREIMISGICGGCFDKVFSEDEI